MAMADGRYYLDRCAFRILNSDGSQQNRFDFSINPQSTQEQTQARTAYMNTKDWGTVQNFGMGQKSITISGTTGWQHGLGIDQAWQLKSFLDTYLNNYPTGTEDNHPVLVFDNYTDNYSYKVAISPSGYQFSQDVSQAILVKYTINMIVIGNTDQASASDRTNTLIGRPGEGGMTDGNMSNATSSAIASLRRDIR